MTDPTTPLIPDGHNDLLFALTDQEPVTIAPFVEGTGKQIDGPKCRSGGFGGRFFAVYVSSPVDNDAEMTKMGQPAYDLELPIRCHGIGLLSSPIGNLPCCAGCRTAERFPYAAPFVKSNPVSTGSRWPRSCTLMAPSRPSGKTGHGDLT